VSARSHRLQSIGLIDGPAVPRPQGYRHRESCRPVELTARQAGLPVKRKFNREMRQRWLAEHNRIQAERLVGTTVQGAHRAPSADEEHGEW